MSATKADIIVGIQWGDEGKGRIIDAYAHDYDIVARFGGGDNAGHTIVVGDQKLALRVVPSGVLVPATELFIGGGTVVSLDGLIAELDALAKIGVDTSRVRISDRAHIVFPYHALIDAQRERERSERGERTIGTTGRGIGPAYVDRVGRIGITFADLAKPNALANKIRFNLLAHASALSGAEDVPSEEDLVARTLAAAERLRPHVVPGVAYLHDAIERGRRVLIEGAQGSLLDVTYGTYPFVTSSSTIAGGACTGLGVGPTAIGSVIGVAKAYCSRVGAGPFPSELDDADGARLRERGGEFGTVTGRPRRCGWFDGVAARYATRLNGLDRAVITKLDVLSGFERIGIVTGYRLGGSEAGAEAMGEPGLETVVEWYPGWHEELGAIRRIADLPANARAYVLAIEEALGVPVERVSLGPERSAIAQ